MPRTGTSNLYRRGGTWYARFAVAGQLQRVSLRTADLREAKARLKGLRLKSEREVFGISEGASWEDVVTAYCEGVLDAGGVKPSTSKRYEVSLRQLQPTFAGRRAAALGVSDIAAYVGARQRSGATNATIRRDLTTISRVLAFAKSQGMVAVNVVDDYDRKLLRETRPGISAPADAMVLAGVAAAVQAGVPELGELMRFLRATGLRAGEALRARWEDVHDGSLTIHETKSGRVRTIELGDASPATRADRGRLFPGMPEDTLALAGKWAWVRRKVADAPNFRLHDLRHAYAIAEIRRGRDIYDLSHHLGHGSVKVTEVYLGYVPGRRATSRR